MLDAVAFDRCKNYFRFDMLENFVRRCYLCFVLRNIYLTPSLTLSCFKNFEKRFHSLKWNNGKCSYIFDILFSLDVYFVPKQFEKNVILIDKIHSDSSIYLWVMLDILITDLIQLPCVFSKIENISVSIKRCSSLDLSELTSKY